MSDQERVRVFDSQGQAYKQAFQIFLDHTDQKRNAKRWLQQVVDGLRPRNVFIDAGAGNGEVTRTFAGAFARTIAIEPNMYLLKQLQQAVPVAEAIGHPLPALPGPLRPIFCTIVSLRTTGPSASAKVASSAGRA